MVGSEDLSSVAYEIRNQVAYIRLNCPERQNALSVEVIAELDRAFKKADAARDVRVVVLTGAGKSFSSGHDLSGMKRPRDGNAPAGSVEHRFEFEERYYLEANLTIRNLGKPTIAGLHGHVVVGGLMTALMCDLIVAEETANLWNPSVRHAGTGGEVMVLPWQIGVRRTKELLWTGDALDVHEAHRIGLINRVVPTGRVEQECQRLAERIALMPTWAVWNTKRSLNKLEEIQGMLLAYEHQFLMHQLQHASNESAEWNAAASAARDAGGVQAWIEFRDAPFREQSDREY